MFSVDTEQEARDLIVLACPTNIRGEYIAPELAREQTLENLDKFGERLAKFYEVVKRRTPEMRAALADVRAKRKKVTIRKASRSVYRKGKR